MRYCKNCGAVLPTGRDRCLICGLKIGEAPAPKQEEQTSAPVFERRGGSASTSYRSAREQPKRLISFGLAICLLLSLGAGGAWLYGFLPTLTSSEHAPARGAIFYVTGDNILKFKSAATDIPQEVVTDYDEDVPAFGGGYAASGPTGRYIAYLDNTSGNSGELFLRDFQAKRDNGGNLPPDILVSRDVVPGSFFFVENGEGLVFVAGDSRLCYTDYTRVVVLGAEVLDAEVLGHSGSKVLFSGNSNGSEGLYVADISHDVPETLLVGEGFEKAADVSERLENVIYVRLNADGSRDLVACDLARSNNQTLAMGIDDVLAADAETTSALYRTKAENVFNFGNFIDDEFSGEDAVLPEPSYDIYPGLREFYENMELDTDEGPVPAAPDGDAETPVTDEYAEEIEMYNADILKYEQKLDRDGYRQEAADALETFLSRYPSLYTLHIYRDGGSERLSSNSFTPFDGAELNAASGVAAWVATEFNGFEKVPISEYETAFAVGTPLEYLLGLVSDNLYIQRGNIAPERVFLGDGAFHSAGWRFNRQADSVFFAMGDGSPALDGDEACNLYHTQLVGGSVLMLDENVEGLSKMLDGDRLLYYKDLDEGVCDLYMLSDLIPERIGDRVYLSDEYLKAENGGRTLLYSERFDLQKQTGNLYMLSTQNRQLATDVSRVFYRSDSLVYFLRAVGGGSGELYAFQSNGLVPVDTNVLSVLE